MKQLWNMVHWSRAHASDVSSCTSEPLCSAHCGLLHPVFLACTPLFFPACWLLDFAQRFRFRPLFIPSPSPYLYFTSLFDSLLCSSFLPFLFDVSSLLSTCLILALLPFALSFLERPFPAATVSASFIQQHGPHLCQGQRGHQSWSSRTSHYSSRTLSKCRS